jgi:hypothetical protein
MSNEIKNYLIEKKLYNDAVEGHFKRHGRYPDSVLREYNYKIYRMFEINNATKQQNKLEEDVRKHNELYKAHGLNPDNRLDFNIPNCYEIIHTTDGYYPNPIIYK